MNFKERVILITGASQGLGYEAAKHFSALGARLVLLSRQREKLDSLNKELGEKHLVIAADLCDSKQAILDIQANLTKWPISCVLHTAGGGLGLRDPLITEEDLIKLFQVNLSGSVALNRLLCEYFKSNGGGNIVHVGSIASYEAVGSVGYNTVKAALAAYVRSLGREMAGSGIIVTGVLPGGFGAKNNAMERLKANKPEVYTDFINNRLPRKQMGTAAEILPIIEFLCSASAGMMCGCLVPIDGAEGKAYPPEAM